MDLYILKHPEHDLMVFENVCLSLYVSVYNKNFVGTVSQERTEFHKIINSLRLIILC